MRTTQAKLDDIPTALAIGVISYASAVLLHEGIGHGSICALTGGAPFVVTTAELQCAVGGRVMAAGGPVINLIVGGVLLLALLRRPPAGLVWRYLLWFAQGYNLSMAFGYFLYSGLTGAGDWSIVFAGLHPELLIRIALAVLGLGLYVALASISSRLLVRRIFGASDSGAVLRLSVLPYLAAGAAAALAASLSRDGLDAVLLSALPSSLGGGFMFFWMLWLVPPESRRAAAGAPDHAVLPRSLPWIGAGIVVLLVFVLVFGPGVSIG